jgi:L-asparaginase/beta-aspartyl-peptidase (threonine type)
MKNTSRIALVVHGGAGNTKANEDGCVRAAQAAFELLSGGRDGLQAVVRAVVSLEDDPRFNAGSGSIKRSDGSVEMDASLMDSRGRLGAVCGLKKVRNPVLVAERVVETPHWMLAGEGALQFARSQGMPEVDPAAQPTAHTRASACDTVGAVALDSHGHFAVASSTGGSAPALPGRVGDTPIPGAGFWAGPHGAVALTGVGEHIVPRMLARVVYDWIERGMNLREALESGVRLMPREHDVGIIAVTRTDAAAASNRSMPFHVLASQPYE